MISACGDDTLRWVPEQHYSADQVPLFADLPHLHGLTATHLRIVELLGFVCLFEIRL